MARTDTLGHYLTDVASAIKTKKGDSTPIVASNFDTEIMNLPSGGSSPIRENDVNLYDYDGTILHSYTKTQFLALSNFPSNPTHEGLTSKGWNWTLADAKSYVTSYGFLDIGQMYEPTDGITKIYVTIPSKALDPSLGLAINGSVTIDWGDNSTSVVTGTGTTSSDLIFTQHVYASAGDYLITLDSDDDIYLIGNDNGSNLMTNPDDHVYSAIVYRSMINKIITSKNVKVGDSAFKKLYSLKSLIIADGITSIGSYIIQSNYSQQYLVIPSSVTTLLTNAFSSNTIKKTIIPNTLTSVGSGSFGYSYIMERFVIPTGITSLASNYASQNQALREVIIPENITAIGGSAFSSCPSLRKITFSSTLTGLGNGVFQNCNSLDKLVFPSTLTSIGSNCFSNAKNIVLFDFRNASQVPSLSAVSAFNGANANAKIVVPDALYSDWTNASKWKDITNIPIVKASEYNG